MNRTPKNRTPKNFNYRRLYHPTRRERLLAAVIRGYYQRQYELNYFNHADFYP